MSRLPLGMTIFSGPSGVGKGTILKRLLERHPDLYLGVSQTTRKPRPGEVGGVDYHFVSHEQFRDDIATGRLLEWNEFSDQFYGTPVPKDPDDLFLVLEIDVNGARQALAKIPDARWVIILPSGADLAEQMTTLADRLRGRGTESEERINNRLVTARSEIAAAPEAHLVVVNDDIQRTVDEIDEVAFGWLRDISGRQCGC